MISEKAYREIENRTGPSQTYSSGQLQGVMNAEEFREKAEKGEIPIKDHDDVLRMAYLYMYEGDWCGGDEGVFGDVEKLYGRGWTFGREDLAFNR